MEVEEFITALIQHIPDRNVKMIRYYGAYIHRIKLNKWAPGCPFCSVKMKFVWYEKGPQKEIDGVGSKLSDWGIV